MNTTQIRLGIISALQSEQAGLIDAMQDATKSSHGMRDYTSGRLFGIDCVCVLSRIGKVAAATTAAMLVERHAVSHILFTGVAGSADAGVRVGDIVVAESLVQHDMNCSPLFPRFQVPLTGIAEFASDVALTNQLAQAAEQFIEHDFSSTIAAADRMEFRLLAPKLHRGLIGSGDEFIACHNKITALKTALPQLLAVEMEGAAVAQVCFELGVPFAIVRTISDNANEAAAFDFTRFVDRIAARYAFDIVRRLCATLGVSNL